MSEHAATHEGSGNGEVGDSGGQAEVTPARVEPPAAEQPARAPRSPHAPPPAIVLYPAYQQLSVTACAACGGDHEASYRPLAAPSGLLTHYYVCPSSTPPEPVPIAVAEHAGKTLEIPREVADMVCRAVLAGRWVVMATEVQRVEKEGGVNGGGEHISERAFFNVHWITHDFPRYALLDVAAKFAADMREQLDPMAERRVAVDPGPPDVVKRLFKARRG